jgi:signal transduction histidine kinase
MTQMIPEATGTEYGRSITDECRVAAPLAARLRDSRASLTLRWLERISARVSLLESEVFPDQDLLDHVPILIESMADYLEDPGAGPGAERVLAKSAELGQMRFEQGFSPYQILKEFEVLGGVVLSYLSRAADDLPVDCPPGEYMICAQRIHHTLSLIQQATAARYLALLETHASEREQRLRAMNAVLSGPLVQRLDDAVAASRELEKLAGGAGVSNPHELRARLERVGAAVDQLRMLSRVNPSSRQQRNVPLKAAAAESIRTLREAARERDVQIRVPEPLPEMEVNAGAVELALLVFLTTMLRHGEPAGDEGDERWIEVRATADMAGGQSVVRVSVRDMGASLPPAARDALLNSSVDDGDSDEPPLGVSLQIVREAIEGLGGRISLRTDESPGQTEFVLELPSRRMEDADRDE